MNLSLLKECRLQKNFTVRAYFFKFSRKLYIFFNYKDTCSRGASFLKGAPLDQACWSFVRVFLTPAGLFYLFHWPLPVYYTCSIDPCQYIIPVPLTPASKPVPLIPASILYMFLWPLPVYYTCSIDPCQYIIPVPLNPASIVYLFHWPLPVYYTCSIDPCQYIVPVPLTPGSILYLFQWPLPVYYTCSIDPCLSIIPVLLTPASILYLFHWPLPVGFSHRIFLGPLSHPECSFQSRLINYLHKLIINLVSETNQVRTDKKYLLLVNKYENGFKLIFINLQ